MYKKMLCCTIFLLCVAVILTGCGTRGKTLKEVLSNDVSVLEGLKETGATIECKDYTLYSIGGIDDSLNATRYSAGLIETTDRFVAYRYVVKDNETGWKYIFQSLNDIPIWATQN